MTATDQALRWLALKTNPYWPFRTWNRLPYNSAVRVFLRRFGARHEIRRIYLRHGLTRGEWVPGLSDIDMTVILREDLSVSEEYRFLTFFWNEYRRLKRFFPMLGEVEILDDGELPLSLHYTARSPGPRHWILLHGRAEADLSEQVAPEWPWRALELAHWIYFDYLPPCVERSDSFLGKQDIRRRTQKIIRTLAPILARVDERRHDHNERGHVDGETGDAAGLVAEALYALDGAVRCVLRDAGYKSPEPMQRRSVISARGKTLLIVEDGLSLPSLVQLVRSTLRGVPHGRGAPVVMTRTVLAYMVGQFNPYDYLGLRRSWVVLEGDDPLDGIAPPGKDDFVRYMTRRVSNLLTFPRSADVFLTPLTAPAVEKELEHGLALCLLLRDNWFSPDRRDLTARWRLAFPECASAFEAIGRDLHENAPHAAREECLALFRSVTRPIRALMSL